MKGRGGFARRVVPPLVGVVIYAAFAMVALTMIGRVSAANTGAWSLFIGPSGWAATAVLGIGTVAFARARSGRIVAAEVATRMLLGLPIVLTWALLLVGALMIGIPSVIVMATGSAIGASLQAGRRVSSLLFPVSSILLLLLAMLTARFYGRPVWLQIAGTLLAVAIAYANTTWLLVWTQKPLEIAERWIQKYREIFLKRYEKVMPAGVATTGEPVDAAIDCAKIVAELDSQDKILDYASHNLRRIARHRVVFMTFLWAFVGTAAVSVVAYSFAYWLLMDDGIMVTDPGDTRSSVLHAVAQSLHALIGDSHSALSVRSTFATVVCLSELILGLYLFIVLILSFTLATSTHLERVEDGSIQVVDDLKLRVAAIRKYISRDR
ncbi:MAG: hypothetical protein IPH86_19285 [bacterium]|nr:hypothetical protein [bacterium]